MSSNPFKNLRGAEYKTIRTNLLNILELSSLDIDTPLKDHNQMLQAQLHCLSSNPAMKVPNVQTLHYGKQND